MKPYSGIFLKLLLLISITVLCTFVYVSQGIFANTITFQSDELYWIQTARILPYIYKGDFQSPYWHEHMGFTNFNGAKWTYAFGLWIFGHADFEKIGIPPQTYYTWNAFENAPFPKNHELFPILLHGRLISATMASLSAGVMVFLVQVVTGNIYIALFSALLLVFHPIFQTIAVHALGDSTFFLGELCIYLLVFYIAKRHSLEQKNMFFVLLGGIVGYTIATKINAYVFVPIAIGLPLVRYYKKKQSTKESTRQILLIVVSMCAVFLLIHPNIFFYRTYTPFMMLADRIQITKLHMNYFRELDPGHVLDTIPSRIHSLSRHLFTLPMIIGSFLSCISVLYTYRKKDSMHLYMQVFLHGGYIFMTLLLYVVFDEQRYFLPLLPFVCIFASFWMKEIGNYSVRIGRNWRASAK